MCNILGNKFFQDILRPISDLTFPKVEVGEIPVNDQQEQLDKYERSHNVEVREIPVNDQQEKLDKYKRSYKSTRTHEPRHGDHVIESSGGVTSTDRIRSSISSDSAITTPPTVPAPVLSDLQNTSVRDSHTSSETNSEPETIDKPYLNLSGNDLSTPTIHNRNHPLPALNVNSTGAEESEMSRSSTSMKKDKLDQLQNDDYFKTQEFIPDCPDQEDRESKIDSENDKSLSNADNKPEIQVMLSSDRINTDHDASKDLINFISADVKIPSSSDNDISDSDISDQGNSKNAASSSLINLKSNDTDNRSSTESSSAIKRSRSKDESISIDESSANQSHETAHSLNKGLHQELGSALLPEPVASHSEVTSIHSADDIKEGSRSNEFEGGSDADNNAWSRLGSIWSLGSSLLQWYHNLPPH